MDALIMFFFLILIWVSEMLIKIEVNRHNSQLPECKQFSMTVENLPRTSEKYTIKQLKADLWEHILTQLRPYEYGKEEAEIVDIQFAFSDYSYLEQL